MSKPPARNRPLVPATLDWREGVPVSQRYDDVYFCRHDGLAESRYVFLRHNDLPRRWRNPPAAKNFVLAETGFGTGLNFLVANRVWLETADTASRLHYVAVEKHPLSAEDLGRALASYEELSALVPELLRQYPPPVRGAHRRHLYCGRVILTLYLMDVADWLSELDIRADAWFLDGFAPARNPEMWSAPVLARVGMQTAPGGTFATFTAAGEVRRRLEAAGFGVNKDAGFAGKREMLHGRLGVPATASGIPAVAEMSAGRPWFRAPAQAAEDPAPERSVVIVGAGLAGAFTALALARRGWRVTVLEQGDRPGHGASGNATAVIYGKFSTHDAPVYRFFQQAYLYATGLYPLLELDADAWSACGVLQLAGTAAERARQQELATLWPAGLMSLLDAAAAAATVGAPLEQGGLYFPGGGWVAPARVCESLLRHPGVELKTGCAVAALECVPGAASVPCWRLLDAAGRVLAVAPTAPGFSCSVIQRAWVMRPSCLR
jgi:tRNA 5-methylaminomethyl-2-thiouridine biosynthesis bifunctional protein